MKSFVDEGEIAGAVTLVAHHGSIVLLEATGYQDIEAKVPMRTDTIFQVMSMTKPFTGTAIMMLREEGRLSLEDPVLKYVPEFTRQRLRSGQIPSRPITIYDLMTHTSGMRARPAGKMKDLYWKLDRTLQEAVASFADEPLQFEPGSKWMYSSMGVGTLGRIIEVVSGQPYEVFITQRLLKPLAMKDSFFFPPPEKRKRIAALYMRGFDGTLHKVNSSMSSLFLGGDPMNMRQGAKYPAPEFGLYSTATDMAHFYQMLLNRGIYHRRRYLSPASISMMTSVQTGDLKAGFLPGAGFGLTLEVIKDRPGSSVLSPGSFGHSGIYGTHGWADPKKDLVGIFMIQVASPTFMKVKNSFFQMAEASVTD